MWHGCCRRRCASITIWTRRRRVRRPPRPMPPIPPPRRRPSRQVTSRGPWPPRPDRRPAKGPRHPNLERKTEPMSETEGPERFPKSMLYAAGLMIALSLALATWSRVTGKGDVPPPDADLVMERSLLFSDHSDGSVRVHDADTGELVEVMAAGTNGFVRSLMRGLARKRQAEGIGSDAPFKLILWDDGRLSLVDPSTDEHVFLNAFGRDNVDAFATLLPPRQGKTS
ncbi:hypothetical protein CCR85_04715 [Rhodothalassium salexigens]|nr:hypothetical protein [Rhodothalassium salexigens]MBK5920541.1 hypothetical protein [Rhodothalassium salexigens]